jgi:hypothetical protein
MPIINGRRVTNVPNAGVYGREIIGEMKTRPGRRPVIQRPGGFETIRPDKRYTKAELLDRKGNPLKVTDIPDRSKGSGASGRTFGGSRDPKSKQIITEQVFDLAEHLFKDGVDFDEDDAHWFVAPRFKLPRTWKGIARETPLMVAFPLEYPTLPPIGFYMKADIPHAPGGHFYDQAYYDAWKDPLQHGWKWYCVYVQAGNWQPASVRRSGDWKDGDNLWTYMTLINETLTALE